jgi:RNA recognition motif. (a.k.a. RRM, RBD, or RNP domain)
VPQPHESVGVGGRIDFEKKIGKKNNFKYDARFTSSSDNGMGICLGSPEKRMKVYAAVTSDTSNRISDTEGLIHNFNHAISTTERMSTPENKTLFLGDLSRFCTEIELEELFSQYGQVQEIKISRTSTGISLGYGFISMAERSQAEEAMVKLRGSVLSGRPIRIDWAARNVRDNNSYASTNDMINSIHVRYHTLQVRATTLLMNAMRCRKL